MNKENLKEKADLISELLELGVIITNPYKSVDGKIYNLAEVATKYENLIYDYIVKSIDEKAQTRTEYHKNEIDIRLKIISFDSQSKREFVNSYLLKLDNQLDTDTLLCFSDKEFWKKESLRNLSFEDYHEFIFTNRIADIWNRDFFQKWLEMYSRLEIIKYIHKRYDEERSEQKLIKSKIETGFKSNLPEEKIKILYSKLLGNYIHPDTLFENFKALFNEKQLPKEFKPIIKEKKFTKTLLAYFISELFQKDNQDDYWKIGNYCFNTKDLAQSYSNAFNTNKHSKPRGSDEIDKILRDI